MSAADNEKAEKMQTSLQKMYHSLEGKSQLVDIMGKNFTLVEAMVDHQTKELKLLKKQNVKLKATYNTQNAELKALKRTHEQIVEEVNFLREKNSMFEEADKHVQFLNERIHNLQMEIER